MEDTRRALEKSSSLPPGPARAVEKTEILSPEERKQGRASRRAKRRDAVSKRDTPSKGGKSKVRTARSELSQTLPLAGAPRRPAHAKETPAGLLEKTQPLARTKGGGVREPSTRGRAPASPPSPVRAPATPVIPVPVARPLPDIAPGPGVMRGATLRRARLVRVDFRGGDLRGADLTEADLGHADLSLARLEEADLSFANLHETKLEGAETRGAKRSGTRNVDPDRR